MTQHSRVLAARSALLLALLCTSAAGAGADLVLSKKGGERLTASGARVWKGDVYSAPGLAQPPGTSTHHATFEFESDDYFRNDNIGHFAVGIRGDGLTDANGDGAPDLRGGGVVLGNVTLYPRRDGCGPTTSPSTIVIESFWAGGNCIHPSSEGPELRNGSRYRVTISYHVAAGLNPRRTISYTLHRRDSGRWTRLVSRSVDDSMNPSPAALGGWFVVEVFSAHDWTLRIYNLRQWWS